MAFWVNMLTIFSTGQVFRCRYTPAGEKYVGSTMKKLGIFGIVSGTLALLWIVGLSVFAYLRGLTNLQKFGADTYLKDLLLNIFNEMWWYVGGLLAFSLVSISLGIKLLKQKKSALKLMIGLYGLVSTMFIIVMLIAGPPFGTGELVFSVLILIWSIRVLIKSRASNHAVQGTASTEPLR